MNFTKIIFSLAALSSFLSTAQAMQKGQPEPAAASSQVSKRLRAQENVAQQNIIIPALAEGVYYPLKHTFPAELQIKIIKLQLATAEGVNAEEKLKNAAKNIRGLLTAHKGIYHYQYIHGFAIKELARSYTNNNIIKAAIALHTDAGGHWLTDYYTKNRNDAIEAQAYKELLDTIPKCNLNAAKFLIRFIPNITAIESDEYVSHLEWATEHNNIEFVRLLLTQENISEENILDALALAATPDSQDVLKELLNIGIDITKESWIFANLLSSPNYSIETIQMLIEAGLDINQYHGPDPLILLGIRGNTSSIPEEMAEKNIQILLSAGADPNKATTNDGVTPLLDACAVGFLKVAKLLIKAGADINARNFEGLTPLMEACNHGHLDVVKELLNSGANIQLTDNSGRTALNFAKFGFPSTKRAKFKNEIIEILKKAGAQ